MPSLLTRTIAVGAAAAMLVATVPGSAEAGYRYHGRYDGGAAVAAGIIGLGVGAILGSALAQPRGYYGPGYYGPGPAYYGPAPVYRRAAPVYYAPEPWSPDWYAYCASKYRSFDARSGTYVTYGGERRYCR